MNYLFKKEGEENLIDSLIIKENKSLVEVDIKKVMRLMDVDKEQAKLITEIVVSSIIRMKE